MNLNSEFVEDVLLSGDKTLFTRSALKNEKMLRMLIDINTAFILPDNGDAANARSTEEHNIKELITWFERQIREWVADDHKHFNWP